MPKFRSIPMQIEAERWPEPGKLRKQGVREGHITRKSEPDGYHYFVKVGNKEREVKDGYWLTCNKDSVFNCYPPEKFFEIFEAI